MTETYKQPTVGMIIADLQKLGDPEAWLLVEVDGHAKPPKGIQRVFFRLPDGREQPAIIIVGSDYLGYKDNASTAAG